VGVPGVEMPVRPIRPLARKLVLLGLASIAITVADCWTIAAIGPTRLSHAEYGTHAYQTHYAAYDRYEAFGVTRLHIGKGPPSGGVDSYPTTLAGWSRLIAPPRDRTHRDGIIMFGYGWPFRAMWAELEEVPRSRTGLHVPIHGLLLLNEPGWAAAPYSRSVAPLPRRRILPLAPIWPGFAANTAIVFAFLFASRWLPRTVLQVRRERKGLCPACAYDLRGSLPSACPECGWNRAPTPQPSPTPAAPPVP
jgi:hypothetical protein